MTACRDAVLRDRRRVYIVGLAEGGVDYSYDEHNRTVLTPAMKQRLDAAKAEIISGKIQVYDEILNLCDYQNLLMRRAIRQSNGLLACK